MAPHIVIRILLTIFPVLYFTSPWLFCNCQFVLLNPFFYMISAHIHTPTRKYMCTHMYVIYVHVYVNTHITYMHTCIYVLYINMWMFAILYYKETQIYKNSDICLLRSLIEKPCNVFFMYENHFRMRMVSKEAWLVRESSVWETSLPVWQNSSYKRGALQASVSGFESWLCHVLAVGCKASNLPNLSHGVCTLG